MDDPEKPLFYDPRHDAHHAEEVKAATQKGGPAPTGSEIHGQGNHAADAPGEAAADATGGPPSLADLVPPRGPVTAEALEELGLLVLRAENAQDLERLLRLVDVIRQLGVGAEVAIRLVPLQYADATSVTAILNRLYQRVALNPASNATIAAAPTTTTAGAFGAITQTTQPASSVVLLPLTRFNSILVAVPQSRMDDVVDQIKRLDVPAKKVSELTPFQLKRPLPASWRSRSQPSGRRATPRKRRRRTRSVSRRTTAATRSSCRRRRRISSR
jgi:type II secretory pathway component GspD/PulD (secretin)